MIGIYYKLAQPGEGSEDVSGRIQTHMPNNPSAEKRMRQEQKRRMHNRIVKSIAKTAVNRARQAIDAGEDAEAAVRAAVSELDRAAKKGVIHRNNAARRKSRLMKRLNASLTEE
jgi:small subunit ribosomal protein S20